MKKILCDRCMSDVGPESRADGSGGYEYVRDLMVILRANSPITDARVIDLCPHCLESFAEWLDGRATGGWEDYEAERKAAGSGGRTKKR